MRKPKKFIISDAEEYDVTKNPLWPKLPSGIRKAIEKETNLTAAQEMFELAMARFAWVNSLIGETLSQIAEENPDMELGDAVREAVKRIGLEQTEDEKIKRYVTIPAKDHKIPNDKVTVSVFNTTTKQWEAGKIKVLENPKDKKRDSIITPVELSNIEGK